MRIATLVTIAWFAALVGNARAQAPASTIGDGSAQIYSGVYASRFNQSLFSPCDVPGIGSGWWLRFNNERYDAFLRYQYKSSGMPTVSHFIRVRGRVSPPGRYGDGFETREIVVDSVLSVSETMQPCDSYEEVPQVWDRVKSSGAYFVGVAATDDRTHFALLDRNGVVNVWDTRTGTLVNQFPSEDKGAVASEFRVPLAFSHDAKLLAVGGVDGVVRVWNPLTGQKLWTLPAADTMSGTVAGQKMVARSVALDFNRSGSLLANNVNELVAIWSMETGKRVATFKEGWWYSRFHFLDDSSFVASGDSGLFKIYPRPGAQPIGKFKTPLRNFEWMEPSADGRWLFLKGWSDTAYVWSLREGQLAHAVPIPPWFGHGAAAFSLEGDILATSGGASGLYLWDTKTGQPLRSFQKFPNIVLSAWFSVDGKSIIVAPMFDSVLRVVRLDAPTTPAQALWPAGSWRQPPTSMRTFGSIVGFVLDQAKKPIVGADIAIFDGDKPGGAPLATTITNAAGRYLLQDVPVRHVVVRAMMRGFASDVGYSHLPAQGAQVDFELKPVPAK